MTNRGCHSLSHNSSGQSLILEDGRVGEETTESVELLSEMINSCMKTIVLLCELLDFHQCLDKLLLGLEPAFADSNVISLALHSVLFGVFVRHSLAGAVLSRRT